MKITHTYIRKIQKKLQVTREKTIGKFWETKGVEGENAPSEDGGGKIEFPFAKLPPNAVQPVLGSFTTVVTGLKVWSVGPVCTQFGT